MFLGLERSRESSPDCSRYAFICGTCRIKRLVSLAKSLAQTIKKQFFEDEKAMRQLVSILLDNALKYSPEGGSIRLSMENRLNI